jgi:hypothetical protein
MKIICLYLVVIILATSCTKNETPATPVYNVKIHLQHTVGSQSFSAGTNYINPMGEQYKLDKFHYYFTNVSLGQNGNALDKEKESYHLIKAESTAPNAFTFPVSANTHNQLQFIIGVDSARNVSGIQSGALDPLNGMFWTWQSGYIMAKAEGSSPASTAHQNMMTYHIGGFSGLYNTVRKVNLQLPTALNTNANGTTTIRVGVDINKFFNGAHILKIADSSISMSHGLLSSKYADNYATMFSIQSMTQQ